MSDSLFSDFDAVSKAQWLAKIEKDLKGRSIDELLWHLPNLTIDPFAHFDDVKHDTLTPLHNQKPDNAWQIGENISIENNDFKKANQQALSALVGGANAICFILDNYPSESHLDMLLKDIELDYIACYFTEKTHNKSPFSFLNNFKNISKNRQKDPLQLRGGIAYDPFADGRHDVKAAGEAILFAKENLPYFTVINIQGKHFFKGSENVVEELTGVLISGENYLKRLINNGLQGIDIAHTIAFTLPIGISYFIEIAKIRAFKLLWGNVLKAYNIPPSVPTIYATIGTETQVADINTNKIRVTTQAMSAVIAGVQCLAIDPSDAIIGGEHNASNIRIARNVQHLLQLESYLDKVIDPAAGSYYIEQLTNQIAEQVWEKFGAIEN